MENKGIAKPDETASAEESNGAVDGMNEQEGAEMIGSVASELGIGSVVELPNSDGRLPVDSDNDDEDDPMESEEPEESEDDADDAADKADESSEDELSDADAKGLTAEGRALVSKRIGKVVAQRNEARERVGALERQLGELREQVEKPVRDQVAQVLGVDPMFLAQSDQDLSAREQHWWQVKRFTEQYMHHEDGFTDDQSGRTFSKEQLIARHAQADEMLMRGLPQARQLFEQRKQCADVAKAAYPDMFKAGTPEASVRSSALKSIPGLAQLPNADILIGDMISGQKAREAAEKKNDKTNTKVGTSSKPEGAVKPAKVPVKPAPAKRSPVSKKVTELNPDQVSIGSVAADLGI